ncbi:DUF4150 domain-containing protein [Novipirellula artificiosorum]|uniref:Uncharacterized protein n=1 Tax=Novipirellula artificiosorum TaxID=2528016 RepID=A0A5C6DW70_9BACT|nr:DUF4150 domain-containing protein [Novipirellula artificiosorum]TWU40595.1 hypothetical protein Poly41_14280 [Novipirellula artificiosorum]
MPTTVHNTTGFVHKGSGGMSLVFPDVCKTPTPGGPVPIPYPNLGKASDAMGTTTVKADGKTIMVKGKKYVLSSLDEPGSVGGVISNTVKGPCEFLTYSFNVMVEGKNLCRMSDVLWHNKKNICG